MKQTPFIDSLRPAWRLFLPLLPGEFSVYSKDKFRSDLAAAITVTLVSIPQVLGFALVLGLPPATVLTCAIVGAAVSACFFSSRLLIFGATNSITLLVSTAIHSPDTAKLGLGPAELAVIIAVLVGLIQLTAGLLQLGTVTQFISRSVVIAYATATGTMLALTQLPNVFGIPRDRSAPLWQQLSASLDRIFSLDFNPAAPLTALASLCLFLTIRRLRPRWPDILLGLVAVTIAMRFVPWLHSLGIQTLGSQGSIAARLPSFAGVPFSVDDLPLLRALLGTALAIALLGMLEGVSLAKGLSAKYGEAIDPNREIVGLGLGNLINGLFASVPGSASFVRSAVNAQSGARTQASGLFAACLLLVGLLTLSSALKLIPVPSLAASLVWIGLRMINFKQIRIAMQATRSDAAVLIGTFVAALLLPLDTAIYTGVGLALALALRKASTPTLVEYDFNDSGNLAQLDSPAQRQTRQVAIIHVEGELFFGAADLFQEHVRRQAETEDLRVIILRLKNARHIDATTVFALHSLHDYLRNHDRHLLISGVDGDVLHVLRRSGLLAKLGQANVFPAELNPNLATKKALLRAQELLGSERPILKAYYDTPLRATPA